MKNLILFLLLFSFSLQASAQYNTKNLKLKRNGIKKSSVESYSFDKLKLYPIYANDDFKKAHQDLGKYISLKDALAGKKVVITETENSETNSTISLDNRMLENVALTNTLSTVAETDAEEENTNSANREPRAANTENQENDNSNQRENVQQIQVQQNNLEYREQQVINTNNRLDIQQRRVRGRRGLNQIRGGGSSATVNTLFIQNISADTVYLMAGEVVKGGKQDRVIAKDVVLPPNSKKINLSVFCVESGRWKYKKEGSEENNFTVSSYMVAQTVRAKAVLKKNQSEVWSEVANVNKSNKIKSSTSAYTALTNSKEYQENTKKYQDHFKNTFSTQKNIIGVVAVTADRVIGADMFASQELFNQQFPQLLSAYITDAMTYGDKVTINDQKVEKYLAKFLSNEAEQTEKMEEGKVFDHKGKRIHLSTY